MGKEKWTHNGEKLAKSLAVIQQEAAPPDLENKSEAKSTSAVPRLENDESVFQIIFPMMSCLDLSSHHLNIF